MESAKSTGPVAANHGLHPSDGMLGMMDMMDGAVQRLAEEIEQLERHLGQLRTASSEVADRIEPNAVPPNRFYEFIMRVELASNRLSNLRSELHL